MKTVITRFWVKAFGKFTIIPQQLVVPILNRNQAGDTLKQSLILIPLLSQFCLFFSDLLSHLAYCSSQLSQFIVLPYAALGQEPAFLDLAGLSYEFLQRPINKSK